MIRALLIFGKLFHLVIVWVITMLAVFTSLCALGIVLGISEMVLS